MRKFFNVVRWSCDCFIGLLFQVLEASLLDLKTHSAKSSLN
ncbi:hypothetical protein LBWT_X0570 (plasmid) [Leptolyngbya boryana IAM M-101]|nr:hypothetical protein LBWT_X0570 [Leptolyngbya boryana IAM M-101]BAS66333.1 hypothetical protein LBDG_X0570 [Leptolyngbya boryana dg5]